MATTREVILRLGIQCMLTVVMRSQHRPWDIHEA